MSPEYKAYVNKMSAFTGSSENAEQLGFTIFVAFILAIILSSLPTKVNLRILYDKTYLVIQIQIQVLLKI